MSVCLYTRTADQKERTTVLQIVLQRCLYFKKCRKIQKILDKSALLCYNQCNVYNTLYTSVNVQNIDIFK